ncbi:hypothetical protein LEP1GSC124_1495 [Leptospira interrogans serovar Pyrogenes str. 200701872]|uniref:Uncharacterized protein n=1 Tax=Leptospira interrogans serovar Pyrogenes str. 200701872 TaxID=1193029 RepID=M6ZHM3_LEPIR|nr:hypothetical protein LEP1GSC124_1495 [Leptospira interrogans serovar Pyrogenes str. 200701872]
MKEAIGHLLNPSTLEPNLGLYSGTLGIDNSREYKTSFLSSLKKIDSVLVDLITEDFLLGLRIFRGPGACKALLNLWFSNLKILETSNGQEVQVKNFYPEVRFETVIGVLQKGTKDSIFV